MKKSPSLKRKVDFHATTWAFRAVDAAFGRFIIGADYHTGLIDIDKTDTMYGEDNHKVGYKHVRNHCFIVRMGINF